MIIGLKEFSSSCKSILEAVDTTGTSLTSEALELVADNGTLTLNVTNGEYFAKTLTKVDSLEGFRATVNAKLFLSLISKMTTDTIELSTNQNFLMVKGNGTYKIKLMADENGLLRLEPISIGNVINEFDIDGKILQSIHKHNSKELLKSGIRSQLQKTFYLDDKGCITFTSGACINPFTLEQPVRVLLPEKIVKLFKLLKSEKVRFRYGVSQLQNGIMQARVSFSNANTEITAKLLNSTEMLDKFPAKSLRELANAGYPCSAEIEKSQLLDSIVRLSLFTDGTQPVSYTYLTFSKDGLDIFDSTHENKEHIGLINPINSLEGQYSCILNTEDLRLTLEGCESQTISMGFGNHRAILIAKDGVLNIMPECIER